jgi:PAP2 superfamily protein
MKAHSGSLLAWPLRVLAVPVRALLWLLDRLASFLDSGAASQQPGAARLRRGLAGITLVAAVATSLRSVHEGGMISPAAVLLAVMAIALYVNRGGRFVRDWLPVFLAFVCYGLVAKAVPELGLDVYYTPQIDADRVLGLGQLPTTWLQNHLYHGSTGPLEVFSLLMYMSHFLAPIALAGLIWLRWPGGGFHELLYGLVTVSLLAEVAFLLAPTAPPWLAAQHGLIPPVDPVIKQGLSDLGLQELARAKGNAELYNVVAAVPSLHAAWPLIGLLVIRKHRLPRWLFWSQAFIVLGVCFAIVYTGEHYVVDALVGFGFAFAAWWLVQWALAAGGSRATTAPMLPAAEPAPAERAA